MHARPLVAAAAILAMTTGSVAARDLSVVALPSIEQAIQEVFARPFVAATTIATQVSSWDGGIDTLRTQAKAPDNTWDLVMVDSDALTTGCSEGLFEKLDWSAIGGKDHYLPQAVSDCGVGAASPASCWHGTATSSPARLPGRISGTSPNSRQAWPVPRRARQPGDSR